MQSVFSFINIIDIIFLIIFCILINIWKNDGIIRGAIKFIGLYCCLFIAIHYFHSFGVLINKYVHVVKSLKEPVAYIFLSTLTILIASTVCESWRIIVALEAHPNVDRWGGFVFAILRSFMICCILFVGIYVVIGEPTSLKAERSMSRVIIGKPALNIYRFNYSLFIKPFFRSEIMNDELGKKYDIARSKIINLEAKENAVNRGQP